MKVTTRVIDIDGENRQMACTQDVCDTLGITLTPPFISNTLKVEPDFRRKNAYYWSPSNVETIRTALIVHLQSL